MPEAIDNDLRIPGGWQVNLDPERHLFCGARQIADGKWHGQMVNADRLSLIASRCAWPVLRLEPEGARRLSGPSLERACEGALTRKSGHERNLDERK